MPCEIYNVILTGETTNELSSQAACANLAKVFSLTEERARAVLTHAPIVVKKNVNADTAKRFQQAFARANLTVRLQAVNERTSLAPHSQSPAAQEGANLSVPRTSSRKQALRNGLAFKTEGSKAFGLLSVALRVDETLWAESTSVVSSDRSISLNSHDASIRKLSGPDGIYLTQYSAIGTDGEICLSPNLPGEVVHIFLNGGLYIKSSAFLACAGSVHVEENTSSTGHAGSGHLYCHGRGDLWLQVCGASVRIPVSTDFNVRSSHLIAWTTGLAFQTSITPKDRSFVNVVGQGRIWLQSQCDESLASVYQHMRS